MIKLLFLAGSTRKESMNVKLAQYATTVASGTKVTATFIDLNNYEMPMYNGDWEEQNGLPESTIKLKELFIENDGFFISSPEYNSSMSPLLKNTLDWLSRPHQNHEEPLKAFKGKVAAIGAVSPGVLGGLRGLSPLRMVLSHLGVIVAPSQTAIGLGHEAFTINGTLVNKKTKQVLENSIDELIKLTAGIKQ